MLISPGTHNLAQALLASWQLSPENTAVIISHADREIHISARQLLHTSLAYAKHYENKGIRSEQVVVDLLPPGEDLLYAFWGAVFLGAIPAILPFRTEKLDPTRYFESLQSLVDITHPAAIAAEAGLAQEIQEKLPLSNPPITISPGEIKTASLQNLKPEDFPGIHAPTSQIALLQHSSGTTGLQKGVALSHQALFNQINIYKQELHTTSDDVIVSWLPLYHDMGLIAGFLLPLLAGIKLVLISPFEWVRAPWTLVQAIHRHRGTLVWLPNFAYNFISQKTPDKYLEGLDLSNLRGLINCSEPMSADSHAMFVEKFSRAGFKPSALSTCYAMAENVFAVSQNPVGEPITIDRVDPVSLQARKYALPFAEVDGYPKRIVSAGKPLPNCQVQILDDNNNRLGERQLGEIIIRSDCMLTGYFNRPDVTSQAFFDGWYRTGDMGYLANGEIFITGRKKDIMIIGGKNVYPQDIEELINRLEHVHPGRVVVFGVFNDRLGTEEIAAVVEVDGAPQLDLDKLAIAIKVAVATGSETTLRYLKLVDERWLIKTSSGKLARAANREKYLLEANLPL